MSKSKPHPRTRPVLTPVPTRARRDGWTPERQVAFLDALAASACVAEACATVGISRTAAYALRARPEAQAFRVAWDAALDLGVRRLTDEVLARAINGVAVPHFFQGEQVGEHRRYDNRLAMWVLRYRDPLRYAATLDQMVYSGLPEQAALAFAKARNRVSDEAHGFADLDAAAPDERDEEDEEGNPVPPPGSPPWEATPLADELARQRDEALAASNAPIGGSHARRARFTEMRRRIDGDAEATRAAGRRTETRTGRRTGRWTVLCARLLGSPPPRMRPGGARIPRGRSVNFVNFRCPADTPFARSGRMTPVRVSRVIRFRIMRRIWDALHRQLPLRRDRL